MTTITISLNGSALSGLNTNPSKSYTISDIDLQSLLNWAAANYATALSTSPTNPQILLAWVQGWVNATKNSVQQFQTTAPVVPAPISIS